MKLTCGILIGRYVHCSILFVKLHPQTRGLEPHLMAQTHDASLCAALR